MREVRSTIPSELPDVRYRDLCARSAGSPVTADRAGDARGIQLRKRAQTFLMAPPLSLRKSAMVSWSGANQPSSHITSTLPPASRSSRRLDCIRLR
jgi:hypothetical protein